MALARSFMDEVKRRDGVRGVVVGCPSAFAGMVGVLAARRRAHVQRTAQCDSCLFWHVCFLTCLMFPSNASWLSPGRSTRSVACCLETVNSELSHTHSRLLVGGHKSELVWDLYIVQSRFHCNNTANKKQQTKQKIKPNNKHQKHSEESDRRSSFFFLWYGRSRSKARSLHENKLLSRKLQHGHKWSHANWQIINTKTKHNNRKARRRSPRCAPLFGTIVDWMMLL